MHCNDPLCDLQHLPDHKHTLFMVAQDAAHRHEVIESLLSHYNVIEFSTESELFTALKELRPALVIVDERTPPLDGFECVRQLRKTYDSQKLPILLLTSADTPIKNYAAQECKADAWISKPYPRSVLIKAISGLMNTKVEKEWEKLAPVQTKALKGTIEVFNNIADDIAMGSPVAYEQINTACTPLIEAVNSNNFAGILSGIKHHDNYTYVHSMRVATMLALFSHAINLSADEQKLLTTGGLLHDVGKMVIPHNVLNKPGKLTPDEYEVMKNHVTASISQLKRNEHIPKGVITIAGQHHEKLDGTGYPFGLTRTKLNDLARMAAIVDIFSALTDRRVYKAPMAPEKALAVMTDEMSRQIDIPLLNLFKERFLDALLSIGS